MDITFQFMEVVEVIADVKATVQQTQRMLTGDSGFVVGWSDAYEDGHRDYGVHFNVLGEVIGLPEQSLVSLGRIADPAEIATRSRAHRSRKGPGGT